MSANGNTAAEVVIALEQLAPQGAVGIVDESQAQGFKIGEAALNRGLTIALSIGGNGSWSPMWMGSPICFLPFGPPFETR